MLRLFKSNLQAVELREKTWMRGLRLAGLPEE
jgi:hypothetical protein